MMAESYRIASVIPEDARRAAAAADYSQNRCTRTEDGCCPLGIALVALGVTGDEEPDGDQFGWYAERLALCDPDGRAYVVQVANEFIDAWDKGEITDLAGALGVNA